MIGCYLSIPSSVCLPLSPPIQSYPILLHARWNDNAQQSLFEKIMNAPSGERDNCDFYHEAYFLIECLFVPILTPRIVRFGRIVPLSDGAI